MIQEKDLLENKLPTQRLPAAALALALARSSLHELLVGSLQQSPPS